jgi:hypothetical protein
MMKPPTPLVLIIDEWSGEKAEFCKALLGEYTPSQG